MHRVLGRSGRDQLHKVLAIDPHPVAIDIRSGLTPRLGRKIISELDAHFLDEIHSGVMDPLDLIGTYDLNRWEVPFERRQPFRPSRGEPSSLTRVATSATRGLFNRFQRRSWRRGGDGIPYRSSVSQEVKVLNSPPSRIREVARPFLRVLADEIGEDAGLAILDGDAMLYIDQVVAVHPDQTQDSTGERLALHTVAAGFVTLATMDLGQIDQYIGTDLASPIPHTLTDPVAIKRRIDQAAKDGYSWGTDEWMVGITSVAAPILTPCGQVTAALGIYGPTYRFPGDHDKVVVGKRPVEVGHLLGKHLEDT